MKGPSCGCGLFGGRRERPSNKTSIRTGFMVFAKRQQFGLSRVLN